jgi:invasion protein IalB
MLRGAAGTMAGLAFLTASGGVAAQAPSPQRGAPPLQPAAAQPALPQPGGPERTSASFGDWVMRCETVLDAGKARKICEVAQGLQTQGQQGLLAQVAVGRLQRSDPPKLTTVLPANVVLPSVVQVQIDEPDTSPLELSWRRCTPGGCVADAVLSEAQLQRLRAKADRIRIAFRDSTNREIVLLVSMKGFAQGYDAFLKE